MRSASATPGPSADAASYLDAPRPFKTAKASAKAAARRPKNLKQMVTLERELALGLDPNAKRRKGKSDAAKRGYDRLGRKLVGVAARALKKRLEKEAAEAAEAEAAAAAAAAAAAGVEAADTVVENAVELGTMDEAAAADGTNDDADVSMASVASSNATAAGSEKHAIDDEERARRAAEAIRYHTVEAPPSLRPAKKYCDVTGLLAPYTDPKTGLQYHSAEIYGVLKTFGPGVDQSYLSLRGDSSAIK